MFLKKQSLMILSLALLSACGHYSEDLAAMDAVAPQDIAPAAGNDFNSYLAHEYMALAKQENAVYDYKAAMMFTEKARAAQKGQEVTPFTLRDFDINEENREIVKQKRLQLIGALQSKNAPENYYELAKAQTQFDSWLEQLEEGHQGAQIKTCMDSFDEAMRKIENPSEDEINYTLDFTVGSTDIGAQGQQKIQEAVQFYQENPAYQFTVIGYINNETAEAGQSNIAVQRALNVRDLLIRAGVPSYSIQAYTGRQQAGIFPADNAQRVNIIMRAPENTAM